MIDWLTHKAHLINMNRISYRLKGVREFNENYQNYEKKQLFFYMFVNGNLGIPFIIIAGSNFRLLYIQRNGKMIKRIRRRPDEYGLELKTKSDSLMQKRLKK